MVSPFSFQEKIYIRQPLLNGYGRNRRHTVDNYHCSRFSIVMACGISIPSLSFCTPSNSRSPNGRSRTKKKYFQCNPISTSNQKKPEIFSMLSLLSRRAWGRPTPRRRQLGVRSATRCVTAGSTGMAKAATNLRSRSCPSGQVATSGEHRLLLS